MSKYAVSTYQRRAASARPQTVRRETADSLLSTGEWFCRWLETYVRPAVRPRTYTAYYGEIYRHILPEIGDLPLKTLEPDDLQNFLNGLLARREDGREGGYSRTTVSHIRTRLISGLGKAEELGLIRRNPAKGLRLPPKDQRERAVFTPSQQKRFERAVKETLAEQPTNAVLLVMLRTGLRAGEAIGLRLGDVDLEDRALHVRRTVARLSYPGAGHAPFTVGDPKTKQSRRTLPIPAELAELLERYLADRAALVAENEAVWRATPGFEPRWVDEGYLFITRKGGLLDGANLRRRLYAIEQAENLPEVSLHGLRHTYATRWVENGLDVKSLSELLGHSDAQLTLNVYTHSLYEQKRECVEKLEKILS